MLTDILSYGVGTLIAFVVIGVLRASSSSTTSRRRSTRVLRNYPVIGRLRYFFEKLGEYFRQYFFAGDRDEMPFNRATRALGLPRWRRTRAASSASARPTTCTTPGAIIFVNHPFPVLEEERLPTPSLMIGEGYCEQPFEARSIVNISGMSFGAISAPAVRVALARRRGRRLLDGHRRGRALAVPPRGRLRRHHADRHRQVRHARRATAIFRRERRRSSRKS